MPDAKGQDSSRRQGRSWIIVWLLETLPASVLVAAATSLLAVSAQAGVTPATKCMAQKMKASAMAIKQLLRCEIAKDPSLCAAEAASQFRTRYSQAEALAARAGDVCASPIGADCDYQQLTMLATSLSRAVRRDLTPECYLKRLKGVAAYASTVLLASAQNAKTPSPDSLSRKWRAAYLNLAKALPSVRADYPCDGVVYGWPRDLAQRQVEEFASEMGPLSPSISLRRLNLVLDGITTDRSPWGVAEITFKGTCTTSFLNASVNGNWVLNNLAIKAGARPTTVQIPFKIAETAGGSLPDVAYGWSLGADALGQPPAETDHATVLEGRFVMSSGVIGEQLTARTAANIFARDRRLPTRAVQPPPQVHTNMDKYTHITEQPDNYCVPGAFADSMAYLQRNGCVGGDASMQNMAQLFDENDGVWSSTVASVKPAYNFARGMTFKALSGFSSDVIETAGEAIDRGCDVEIDMVGHTAVLVSVAHSEGTKYDLWVAHDIDQGSPGGEIFMPMGLDTSTGELETVMEQRMEGVFIECPDPSYTGPCTNPDAPPYDPIGSGGGGGGGGGLNACETYGQLCQSDNSLCAGTRGTNGVNCTGTCRPEMPHTDANGCFWECGGTNCSYCDGMCTEGIFGGNFTSPDSFCLCFLLPGDTECAVGCAPPGICPGRQVACNEDTNQCECQ